MLNPPFVTKSWREKFPRGCNPPVLPSALSLFCPDLKHLSPTGVLKHAGQISPVEREKPFTLTVASTRRLRICSGGERRLSNGVWSGEHWKLEVQFRDEFERSFAGNFFR